MSTQRRMVGLGILLAGTRSWQMSACACRRKRTRSAAPAAQRGEEIEFAAAQPLGFHPSDGLCLFVHPWFANQPDNLPLLVAYHIPTISYGPIFEPQPAELFGATMLGLDVETYYRALRAGRHHPRRRRSVTRLAAGTTRSPEGARFLHLCGRALRIVT